MKYSLPIIIAILLVFAPFLGVLSKQLGETADAPEIPFHTAAHKNSWPLPQHITSTLTIGPQNGIITVHDITTVAKGAHLIIQPGTTIAFSEYAGLQIRGSLTAKGTQALPISFISDELNESNKNWSGIFLEQGSSSEITRAVFHHASPSISCDTPSHAVIQNINSLFGNTDIYGNCN